MVHGRHLRMKSATIFPALRFGKTAPKPQEAKFGKQNKKPLLVWWNVLLLHHPGDLPQISGSWAEVFLTLGPAILTKQINC